MKKIIGYTLLASPFIFAGALAFCMGGLWEVAALYGGTALLLGAIALGERLVRS